MDRAVIYARLSDTRGEAEGIDRQLRELHAHAERLGLEVIAELIDEDLSAAKRKRRPAFERLMGGIAADEWDVVILRSLDRWVRRPAELERIIEVVEKSKVKVNAIHGEIDLRTRNGRLQARVVTAVAMNEVEATRERVTDWHTDRAARGKRNGKSGIGYRREDDREVIHPEEAEAIRAGAAAAIGGASMRAIARMWDEMIPQETKWSGNTVKRVLVNPRNAGLRVHKGEVVGAGDWEPILDRFTSDRLRSLLTRPERRTQVSTTPYLLTGILVCHKCGATMNNHPYFGKRKYACKKCHGTVIAADRVDAYVQEELFAVVDRPDLTRAVNEERDLDEEEIDRQILQLEAEAEVIAVEYSVKGAISVAEWKIVRDGIKTRIDELRKQQAKPTLREWQGRGSELAKGWDEMPIEQQRRILRAWIPEIVVGPGLPGMASKVTDRLRFP